MSGAGDVLAEFNQSYDVTPNGTFTDNGDFRHEGFMTNRPIGFYPFLSFFSKGPCNADWVWYQTQEIEVENSTFPSEVSVVRAIQNGFSFGLDFAPAMGLELFYAWIVVGDGSGLQRYANQSNSRVCTINIVAQYFFFSSQIGGIGSSIKVFRREVHRIDMPENCREASGVFDATFGALIEENIFAANIFEPVGYPAPPSTVNPGANFSVQVEF